MREFLKAYTALIILFTSQLMEQNALTIIIAILSLGLTLDYALRNIDGVESKETTKPKKVKTEAPTPINKTYSQRRLEHIRKNIRL